jgi:hypothetical protein
MACRKTCWRKCVPGDRGIYKDRRVRIIIECPESDLHLEAGYICADCPFVNFNPLAVRRRTIHLRQLRTVSRFA